MAAFLFKNPAALGQNIVHALIQFLHGRFVRLTAAHHALGHQAHFLHDALPFQHLGGGLDPFKLIAERTGQFVIGQ